MPSEDQGFPHGLGGADDVIFMPLQARRSGTGSATSSTMAWPGTGAAPAMSSPVRVTCVTGIETVAAHLAGRGVLLDVGRTLGDGRRAAGRVRHHRRASRGHDRSAGPERTRRVAVTSSWSAPVGSPAPTRPGRRPGWGDYAGGAAPGLSFTTADWLHGTEIAGIATDTWGFEVRPNEFDEAFQPLHQVAIPHIGLFIGEMWDLDALAADCAADGVYDFWLTAAPLPVTGAVGAPVNPLAVK